MFKAAAVAGFLLASAVPAMASAADDVIVSVVPDAGLAASALLAHEEALEWDPEIVLSGSEIAED